ncbi:MAG: hypothetical protein JXR88_13810 [Clostridia bacterium]|nr:hypothetical protein [Clostridia bacterium]
MKQQIKELIIEKIKREYKDTVDLLVEYNHIDENESSNHLNLYYIPNHEKAMTLSTQFILDGIGYDLFPMKWERLIGIASMDSPQAYLFEEANILYAGNPEAEKRFQQLRQGLNSVLRGDYKDALLNKSFEYLNESYIYLFNMKNNCKTLTDYRMESLKLMKQVAHILAFLNKTYYKGSNGSSVSIIETSMTFEIKPENYEVTINDILDGQEGEVIYNASEKLILKLRQLLEESRSQYGEKEPFELLFKGYFEEMMKYLNAFKNAIRNDNFIKQLEVSSFIQEEVAQFLYKTEQGLWFDDRNVFSDYNMSFLEVFSMDLIELVYSHQPEQLLKTIDAFESQFRKLLRDHEVELLEFASIEALKTYMK